MTIADEKTNGLGTEPSEAKARNMTWLWALLGGLLFALLLLAVLLLFVRPMLARKAAVVPVAPLDLQAENLGALEGEIAALKNGLLLEPCAMPPLPDGAVTPPLETPGPADGPPAAAPPPEAASGSSLVDRVESATVMVLVESGEGVGNGSGFFVAPNLVLTNRHVVDALIGPADKVYVTNKVLGGLLPAEIVRATGPDEMRDYALLSVALPSGVNPGILEFSPEFKKTDRVSAWGYPILLTKTDPKLSALMEGDAKAVPDLVYSEGVISVVQDFHGLTLINHTAEVSPGNSGGPLVNEAGRVVGINTMIRVDEDSNRQVNVALGSGDLISFSAAPLAER